MRLALYQPDIPQNALIEPRKLGGDGVAAGYESFERDRSVGRGFCRRDRGGLAVGLETHDSDRRAWNDRAGVIFDGALESGLADLRVGCGYGQPC